MIAEHYTRRWQEAGLIDAGLAERILAWEAAHHRPVFLWAIAGMGTLAVSLGLLAIVGANWEHIPASFKLAVDLALNGLCAVAVFVFWRRGQVWRREIAALLLFGLVLSGIALIGQVYQLQSAPWRGMLLWLALCTPFLALTTTTRLSGIFWAAAAVVTWNLGDEVLLALFARLGLLPPHRSFWDIGYLLPLLSYLACCGMVVIAVLRGLWAPARAQADMLLQLALAGTIAVCSFTLAFAWEAPDGTRPFGPLLLSAVAAGAASLAVALGQPSERRRRVLALVAGSFVFWAAGLVVTDRTGMEGDLIRGILFILYWGAIGGVAAAAGWRGVFGFAFTMIGLRLMGLYLEAIGGLSETGFGLIGGGLLCFLLAALGLKLTRRVMRRPAKAAT